jgi:nitrous oxidase accessory protein
MRAAFTILTAIAATAAAGELHVGEGRAHATIHGAIAAASAGDSVVVHGGTYAEGNLVIGKPLTLRGEGRPVVDGGGKTEVFTITAPDVTLGGFIVRRSGSGSLEDLAGIKVSGTQRATITGNEVSDCHFAIYVSKSKDCLVSGNRITGVPRGEQDTGNGIHLWSCERVSVVDNLIRRHRDGIYLEFATASHIERNTVEDCLRYGLHYMFSHESVYTLNTFRRNGAGVAVMYSRKVEMSRNHFERNWGSSSYGLLLKDMTDGSIAGNDFDSNSTGIAVHGSNRMTIEGNRFANNGWAIQVEGSSSDNIYRNNNFTGNAFDVAAEANVETNRFENNYWQKYEGYDLRRDGCGDVPHRPVGLYSVVVGRVPPAMLLLRSPIVHLLDQAEKAFPTITPERVLDESPAMRPHPFSLPETKPTKDPQP